MWRFEKKVFKTQKWVSMFLSYLVEIFFLVILRWKTFFHQKFSKQIRFFCQFFEISQVVRNPVLAKPYNMLEGLFFGQWKLTVFVLAVILL
jgi:hypothetical protein